MGDGGVHVRSKPQKADTQGENAQQNPSDKAEFQYEQLPFVSVHHPFAGLYAFVNAVFRMVFGDEVGHAVCESLYDAGYDQQ